jgi:hypothetical protein
VVALESPQAEITSSKTLKEVASTIARLCAALKGLPKA